MPYVMPSDLQTRRLAGEYKTGNFIVPYSSLPTPNQKYVNASFLVPAHTPNSNESRENHLALLSGSLVTSTYAVGPLRTGLAGISDFLSANGLWIALVAGGLLLFPNFLPKFSGGRRRRSRA